jgi:hypothetical protein
MTNRTTRPEEKIRGGAREAPTRPPLHKAVLRSPPSDGADAFRIRWVELLRLLRDPTEGRRGSR